jgi:hypothetical protein
MIHTTIQSYQVLQRDADDKARVHLEDEQVLELPVGGSYTVGGAHDILIGDLWVLAGQRNMEGVGDLVDVEEPSPYGLIRNLADTKLRQSNEGSDDLLTKRPIRFPCTSSVLRISEVAYEPTYRSKTAVLADPSMIIDSPIPSKVRAAIKVVFLPRLRGALPCERTPLGARAYRGVSPILEPHSSITTSLQASSCLSCSRQAARASSLRSEAREPSFFLRRQSFLGELFFKSREVVLRRDAEAVLHAPGLLTMVQFAP